MNTVDIAARTTESYKRTETWCQDAGDPDLWRHESGLIINSAALAEREFFYSLVRIDLAEPGCGSEQHLFSAS